jgi:hypothetical protein
VALWLAQFAAADSAADESFIGSTAIRSVPQRRSERQFATIESLRKFAGRIGLNASQPQNSPERILRKPRFLLLRPESMEDVADFLLAGGLVQMDKKIRRP